MAAFPLALTAEIAIEFAVNSELLNKNTQQKLNQIEKSFAPTDKNIHLNPRFLFENFIYSTLNKTGNMSLCVCH